MQKWALANLFIGRYNYFVSPTNPVRGLAEITGIPTLPVTGGCRDYNP